MCRWPGASAASSCPRMHGLVHVAHSAVPPCWSARPRWIASSHFGLQIARSVQGSLQLLPLCQPLHVWH